MSLSRIHSTQAWRTLAKHTIKTQPVCWIQLPGCTHISTTADHVIPISIRPDLALHPSNVRGACKTCNDRRGNIPADQLDQLRAMRSSSQADIAAAFSPQLWPIERPTDYRMQRVNRTTWRITATTKKQPRQHKKPNHKQLELTACPVCSTLLLLDSRRRYCSDECATEGNARQNREQYRRDHGLSPTYERPRKPRNETLSSTTT